jgi:tRNA threonylcarbamoyladenosine biosynthesis protein TsaE
MATTGPRFLPDAAATHRAGQDLAADLAPGTILLLSGDLGSGKTALVQGLGIGLGIEDAILSPTFTIVNEYLQGRIPLYHLDLYRLEPREVADLALERYWDPSEVALGLVAIEWPERLDPWPDSYWHLQITRDPVAGRWLGVDRPRSPYR